MAESGEERKPEPMELLVLRRRFRSSLAYAATEAGAWAASQGWTIQHLNACLRGERPITEEMREKLLAFINEQFGLMLEERGADSEARRLLVTRAVERYFQDKQLGDLVAEVNTRDESGLVFAARLADMMEQIEREDLERSAAG